jgi:hypothetical protein
LLLFDGSKRREILIKKLILTPGFTEGITKWTYINTAAGSISITWKIQPLSGLFLSFLSKPTVSFYFTVGY